MLGNAAAPLNCIQGRLCLANMHAERQSGATGANTILTTGFLFIGGIYGMVDQKFI